MSYNNYISILGLLTDILGSWYLAKALIKKPIKEMRSESMFTFFNYNYGLSMLTQKTESGKGFCFLFMGFLLQGFSYIDSQIKSLPLLFVIIFSSLAIALLIMLYWRKKNKTYVIEFVKDVINNESKGTVNQEKIPINLDQTYKYLTLLNKSYLKKNPINEFYNKYPDYQNMPESEEKHIALNEWQSKHKHFWDILKKELRID